MTKCDSDGVFTIPSGSEWIKAIAKFLAVCAGLFLSFCLFAVGFGCYIASIN